MGNMSYCRFENALPDLRDCYDAMGEFTPDELSKDEARCRRAIIKLACRIADEYGDELDE